MIFNATTITTLKNFSSINPSIMMKRGNILRTISPQKSVMAVATLDQDLEGNAGIYDLSRFLSTVSLFDQPDVSFGENKFSIKGGRSRVNYTFASESMILTPPEKDINLPSVDVSTEVKWEDFDKVMRAASVLKLNDIAFIGDANGIRLAAVDVSNPSADMFDITLDETPQGSTFQLVFRSENLKLLPYDYSVEISSKGISKFQSSTVTYFIAVETSSTFK